LGGSHPFTYIGQALGPFVLPCHLHCDFKDPEWKAKAADTPQCFGASTFRANIGAQMFMPPQFPRVEKNLNDVFASPAQFLAHHLKLSVPEAMVITNGPGFFESCLRREMSSPNLKTYEVPHE
jgi:hypothetical protein